jgi:hypothetical protein
MRLEATCAVCGRTFLLDQLLEGPVVDGRCPWCEEQLAPEYGALLSEAIRIAERGGADLVTGLKDLRDVTRGWATMSLERRAIFDPVEEQLVDGRRTAGRDDDLRPPAGISGPHEIVGPESAPGALAHAAARLHDLASELTEIARRAQGGPRLRAVPPWGRVDDDRGGTDPRAIAHDRTREALGLLKAVLREAEEAAIALGS